MQCGNNGLWTLLDGLNHGGLLRLFQRLAEFAQVRTCDESGTGTNEHAGMKIGIVFHCLDTGQHPTPNNERTCVNWRIVDRDNEHIASALEMDLTVLDADRAARLSPGKPAEHETVDLAGALVLHPMPRTGKQAPFAFGMVAPQLLCK